MINKDHFLNLASAYVLNALDDKERALFEDMLKKAPDDLKREYEKLLTAAHYLPIVAKQNEPPSGLKKELITQIQELSTDSGQDETIPKPRSMFERVAHFIGLHRPQIAIVIILILLIITIGFIFFSSKLYYTDEAQQQNIITLQSNLKEKNYLLSILQNRKINIIYLNGTPLDSNAYGKIIFAPGSKKAMLLVSNLPGKNDKTYFQLWIKDQSVLHSAGIFNITGNQKNHYFAISDISGIPSPQKASYFITLEHKAGASHPSDSVYLKSGNP